MAREMRWQTILFVEGTVRGTTAGGAPSQKKTLAHHRFCFTRSTRWTDQTIPAPSKTIRKSGLRWSIFSIPPFRMVRGLLCVITSPACAWVDMHFWSGRGCGNTTHDRHSMPFFSYVTLENDFTRQHFCYGMFNCSDCGAQSVGLEWILTLHIGSHSVQRHLLAVQRRTCPLF